MRYRTSILTRILFLWRVRGRFPLLASGEALEAYQPWSLLQFYHVLHYLVVSEHRARFRGLDSTDA